MKENVQQPDTVHSNDYWRQMYDELEEQVYHMMEMTLELIEKESNSSNPKRLSITTFNSLHAPSDFQKEFRRLQLFEHRIHVTFLGRITLRYIALKRILKKLLHR